MTSVKASLCTWRFFGSDTHTTPLRFTSYEDLLMTNQIHVTTMVRREDFFRVGGFDESPKLWLEDWDFWLRLLDGEPPEAVSFSQEPLFLYRRRPDSLSRQKVRPAKRLEFQEYMLQKHAERYLRYFGDTVTPPMIGFVKAAAVKALMTHITPENASEVISRLVYYCMQTVIDMYPDETRDEYIRQALKRIKPWLPHGLQGLSRYYRKLVILMIKDPDIFAARVRRRERLRAPVRALWHRLRKAILPPAT